MRQAERKFITSTHIPDLDNANVGTYMITFFIESLITGDTLVSPVFHLIGNINLNRRTKNTHKMGMGNFKESAGMLKNTL